MAHGFVLSGLWLQLAGSLAAVLALAAYVRWLWDRRARAPLDRDGALAIFGAEHPESEAVDALVTADGRAALVRLAERDRLGVVAAFGARWRTRVIGRSDLARFDASAAGVRLVLREIAQGGLVLRFAGDAEVEPWLAPLREGAR